MKPNDDDCMDHGTGGELDPDYVHCQNQDRARELDSDIDDCLDEDTVGKLDPDYVYCPDPGRAGELDSDELQDQDTGGELGDEMRKPRPRPSMGGKKKAKSCPLSGCNALVKDLKRHFKQIHMMTTEEANASYQKYKPGKDLK
jgi:hypothetical protein